MRELAGKLYLTRREVLKAIGISAVALSTECIDYFRPRETPVPKKRFTPELMVSLF